MTNCPVCGIHNPYTFQRCDCVIPEEVEEVLPEEVIVETPVEEEAPVEEAEEEEEEEVEDLEAYLEELPIKELKKLCKEADLSAKGKKADLVERLLE
jgi:hypothetical protein